MADTRVTHVGIRSGREGREREKESGVGNNLGNNLLEGKTIQSLVRSYDEMEGYGGSNAIGRQGKRLQVVRVRLPIQAMKNTGQDDLMSAWAAILWLVLDRVWSSRTSMEFNVTGPLRIESPARF